MNVQRILSGVLLLTTIAGCGTSKNQTPDSGSSPTDGSTFVRKVTLGFDDGIALNGLYADPMTEGWLKVSVDAKLLPVQILEVRFIPLSSYSAVLSIKQPGDAVTPGASLGSKSFTVTDSDVNNWFSLDLSGLNLTVNSSFWVVIAYPGTLRPMQNVLYGGTSSAGNNYYSQPGMSPYTVDFNEILRITVTTSNNDVPVLGNDGDSCKFGVDCAGGYCAGARCSKACLATNECGAGGLCINRPFSTERFCVPSCKQDSDCADEAFCLISSAPSPSICVRGGPFTDGTDCTDHIQTICSSGHCSACNSNPTTCPGPGTCQARQVTGGVDAGGVESGVDGSNVDASNVDASVVDAYVDASVDDADAGGNAEAGGE
jgi:hypothetical protein